MTELVINPIGTLATLGRFAHYYVKPEIWEITSRPGRVFSPERLIISGPAANAADWLVHDIRIGSRSHLNGQSVPSDLFAATASDVHMALGVVESNMDIAISVSNIGAVPREFNAAMIGLAPVSDEHGVVHSSQRLVLPFRSNTEIPPQGGDGEFGDHVVIELDDVLYRVDLRRHNVELTKIDETKLTGRDLEEIDAEYDRRELVADRDPYRGSIGGHAARVVMIHAISPPPTVLLDKTATQEQTAEWLKCITEIKGDVVKDPIQITRFVFPYGFIVRDEQLDLPILAIGHFNNGLPTVEWSPGGYTPTWLSNAVEES